MVGLSAIVLATVVSVSNLPVIQLETQRLILRPTQADDWPHVRDFLTCEDTMRHLGGHQQEPDAWRTLAQWIGLWSLTNAAMFAVIEKSSGDWIAALALVHGIRCIGQPWRLAGVFKEGLLGTGLCL